MSVPPLSPPPEAPFLPLPEAAKGLLIAFGFTSPLCCAVFEGERDPDHSPRVLVPEGGQPYVLEVSRVEYENAEEFLVTVWFNLISRCVLVERFDSIFGCETGMQGDSLSLGLIESMWPRALVTMWQWDIILRVMPCSPDFLESMLGQSLIEAEKRRRGFLRGDNSEEVFLSGVVVFSMLVVTCEAHVPECNGKGFARAAEYLAAWQNDVKSGADLVAAFKVFRDTDILPMRPSRAFQSGDCAVLHYLNAVSKLFAALKRPFIPSVQKIGEHRHIWRMRPFKR